MSERRVTLSDIAEKAGGPCHDRVVGHAQPPPPARDRRGSRIQALAQEMGYTPDPLLRALVAYRGGVIERRNTPTLAYVTNWATRWGWKNVTAHPDFYEGALAKAKELGYILEHFWMREEGMSQERLGQILYSRGINGLIIASHGREMGDALQFKWENFSAVKIDYFPHQPAAAQRDQQPVRHRAPGHAEGDRRGLPPDRFRDAPRLGPRRGPPLDRGLPVRAAGRWAARERMPAHLCSPSRNRSSAG